MCKTFPKPETLLKNPVDKWVWILSKEQVILFSAEIFVLRVLKLLPVDFVIFKMQKCWFDKMPLGYLNLG